MQDPRWGQELGQKVLVDAFRKSIISWCKQSTISIGAQSAVQHSSSKGNFKRGEVVVVRNNLVEAGEVVLLQVAKRNGGGRRECGTKANN